MFRNLTNS